MRPVVSVLIPTYNRPHLLRRAVRSVLTQSYGDLEVLIIDDGPSDEAAAVVEGLADPRLRYLRQPENRGVSAARNRGLDEARGTFIAFLDDDDEWLSDKLARQVELLQRSPEVGLVYTGVETVHRNGRRTIDLAHARGNLYPQMLVRNLIHGGGSNVLMRRSLVDGVGRFDEHLPAIEDYDYWLRISRHCLIDCIPEPLIRYYDDRTAEESVRRSVDLPANLAARAMLYSKHKAQMRAQKVAHRYLLDSARRHLRAAPPDRAGALRLMLRAIFEAPMQRDGYAALAHLLLPAAAIQVLRSD